MAKYDAFDAEPNKIQVRCGGHGNVSTRPVAVEDTRIVRRLHIPFCCCPWKALPTANGWAAPLVADASLARKVSVISHRKPMMEPLV